MKRKTLVAVALVVLLCFGFNLVSLATSPKDLVLMAVDKMDFASNQKDLNRLSGNITLTVDKLEGNSATDVNIPAGTKLSCDYKLNVPDKKAVGDFKLKYNDKNYNGQVYLTADKFILTKSLLLSLAELSGDPEYQDQAAEYKSQLPAYFYGGDEKAFEQIWGSLLNPSSQVEKVAKEEKELFKFLLEAVPPQYLSMSGNSITLKLDQNGFITTVNAVLQKIAKEQTRFASIVTNIAVATDTTGAAEDPGQMKADIIAGIEEAVQDGTWPTEDQVKTLGDFMQIKQCNCQISILPGGAKSFDVSIALKPESGYTGQIDIHSKYTGPASNLTGNSSIKLQLKDAMDPDNNVISGAIENKFKATGQKATSDSVLTATVQLDGVKELDLQVSMQATEKFKDNNYITIPVLNDANSMNMDDLGGLFVPAGDEGAYDSGSSSPDDANYDNYDSNYDNNYDGMDVFSFVARQLK